MNFEKMLASERLDMAAGKLEACDQIRDYLHNLVREGHIPVIAIDRVFKCCNDVRDITHKEYMRYSSEFASLMLVPEEVTA